STVEEKTPVNRPIGRKLSEADKTLALCGKDGQPVNRLVQTIDGADHRMAEPVDGHRKLNRHECFLFRVVKLQLRLDVYISGFDRPHYLLPGLQTQDSGQKIMQHHPLVAPTDPALNLFEVFGT